MRGGIGSCYLMGMEKCLKGAKDGFLFCTRIDVTSYLG